MLADDIKRAREAQGSTQEQLAELCGLSLTSIKAYERGKVPSDEALRSIHAALPQLILGSTPGVTLGKPRSGEWEVAFEIRAGDLSILVRRPR